MEEIINRLKEEYLNTLENYRQTNNGNIGSSRFDFTERFKISNAIEPSFNTHIIESEGYRASLKQSLLLSEYWFTYENLILSIRSIKHLTFDRYTITNLIDGNNEIIKIIIEEFERFYKSKSENKYYLILLNRLKDSSQESLKTKINIVIKKIEEDKKLLKEDLIAIIYAIRNCYVHEGKINVTGLSLRFIKEITEILVNILKIFLYLLAIGNMF